MPTIDGSHTHSRAHLLLLNVVNLKSAYVSVYIFAVSITICYNLRKTHLCALCLGCQLLQNNVYQSLRAYRPRYRMRQKKEGERRLQFLNSIYRIERNTRTFVDKLCYIVHCVKCVKKLHDSVLVVYARGKDGNRNA